MNIRKPAVAGAFYPADAASCKTDIAECLSEYSPPKDITSAVAAIVPHAGWTFSGALAALAFNTIKRLTPDVDTFLIFGAAHSYRGPAPAVYDRGAWQTPLGDIEIDAELAKEILETGAATSDNYAHEHEHSIEVQIPFIQILFPNAKLLPILTPPSDQAIELGTACGQIIKRSDKNIIAIASTDLTHYGPRYGFAPMGVGADALDWATNVNDKEFIDFAIAMKPADLLDSAMHKANACGPGATSAAVAAAKELGVTKGKLLAHTNSNEIMQNKYNQSSAESVGYAAIAF
jgi:hypothetical protein